MAIIKNYGNSGIVTFKTIKLALKSHSAAVFSNYYFDCLIKLTRDHLSPKIQKNPVILIREKNFLHLSIQMINTTFLLWTNGLLIN